METATARPPSATPRGSTPRVAALLERAMAAARTVRRLACPSEIDAIAVNDSDEPALAKRARAVDQMLRRARPVIADGEWIVGQQPWCGAPGLALLRERGILVPKLCYLVPDFALVLSQGLDAVRGEALRRRDACDESKRPFYEAVLTVIDALLAYAEAYAAEAERLASDAADPARRDELLEIARVCRRVPRLPARTMHEALQSVWFVDMGVYVEGGGPAFSLGRPDQYLLPFWRADERETMRELIECFWIKSFEEGHVARRGVPTLCLAGQTSDGRDATNDLTYLMLDVTESLRLIYPSVAVRFHAGSPPQLMERSLRVLASGVTQPQFINDEVMVPAWTANGVALEDARDYSLVGCHEPTIPGRILNKPAANPGYVTFVAWLRKALAQNGRIQSYDDLRGAFREAMQADLAARVATQNDQDKRRAQLMPQPFLSALTADGLERGLDISEGGARYNFSGFQGIGLGTAADSLAALRQVVFERRAYRLDEVLAALEADFEGSDGLRQALAGDAPKFGNDDDEVDSIAAELADEFCTEVKRHTTWRGGRFLPALWSVWLNTTMGNTTPATPDGRKAGRPLSHSAGPSLGAARNGPTAIVKSTTKLDFAHAANGSSVLMHLQPELLGREEGRAKLAALVRTYFERGGLQIHFDAVSVEQLQAAQQHPEEHQDLIVRRAGYSEYFVTLGADEQQFVIDRLRHGLV